MGIKAELIQKIQSKTMTMGVCGLGYVGLPLAVDKAKVLENSYLRLRYEVIHG